MQTETSKQKTQAWGTRSGTEHQTAERHFKGQVIGRLSSPFSLSWSNRGNQDVVSCSPEVHRPRTEGGLWPTASTTRCESCPHPHWACGQQISTPDPRWPWAAALRETLSRRPSAPVPGILTHRVHEVNICCFKLLHLRSICYTAIITQHPNYNNKAEYKKVHLPCFIRKERWQHGYAYYQAFFK